MIFTPQAPLLAIDTAGSACSVALWAGRSVLAHEVIATLHGHAVALAPMIARITAGAGVDPKQVGAIAVSCGPGGFTGMRVGLATARAMALAIGCHAIGIGSFQVLAATALRSAGPPSATPGEGNILAVLDSRREELFAAELNPSLTPAAEPALLRMEDVASLVRARGLRLIAEADLTDFAGQQFTDIPVHHARPDAMAVAELAALRPDLHLAAEPIYLRPPDVSQPKPALVPPAGNPQPTGNPGSDGGR